MSRNAIKIISILLILLSLTSCNKNTTTENAGNADGTGSTEVEPIENTDTEYNNSSAAGGDASVEAGTVDYDYISLVEMGGTSFDFGIVEKNDVLFSNKDVTVSYNGLNTWISKDVGAIELKIENKTSNTIYINIDSVSVNGINISNDISEPNSNLKPKYTNNIDGGTSKLFSVKTRKGFMNTALDINNIYTANFEISYYSNANLTNKLDLIDVNFRIKDGKSDYVIKSMPIQLNGPIQFGVISKVVDKQYDEFGLCCILLNDTDDTIKFNINNKDILINGVGFKGTAALENKVIRPHQYYILDLEFNNETLKNNSIESYEDIKQLSLKPTYSISDEVMKLGTWVINLE